MFGGVSGLKVVVVLPVFGCCAEERLLESPPKRLIPKLSLPAHFPSPLPSSLLLAIVADVASSCGALLKEAK